VDSPVTLSAARADVKQRTEWAQSSPGIAEEIGMMNDFDALFARPAVCSAGERETLLGVRLGGDLHALRIRELAGLEPMRRIVPVPGGRPGLRGIAGLRGALLPVYGLAELLGCAGGPARGRWIALCRADGLVGLELPELQALLQATPDELCPSPGSAGRGPIRGVLRCAATEGAVYAVVSVPALLEQIAATAREADGSSTGGTS